MSTPLDDRFNRDILERAAWIADARGWIDRWLQGKVVRPACDLSPKYKAAIRAVVHRRGIHMPAGL